MRDVRTQVRRFSHIQKRPAPKMGAGPFLNHAKFNSFFKAACNVREKLIPQASACAFSQ